MDADCSLLSKTQMLVFTRCLLTSVRLLFRHYICFPAVMISIYNSLYGMRKYETISITCSRVSYETFIVFYHTLPMKNASDEHLTIPPDFVVINQIVLQFPSSRVRVYCDGSLDASPFESFA